jgi:hypothetical protein
MLPGICMSVNTTATSKRPSSGLVRIPRFDDFKGFFDHFNGVHPDQQFVFDDKDNRAFRF